MNTLCAELFGYLPKHMSPTTFKNYRSSAKALNGLFTTEMVLKHLMMLLEFKYKQLVH